MFVIVVTQFVIDQKATKGQKSRGKHNSVAVDEAPAETTAGLQQLVIDGTCLLLENNRN